MVRIFLTAKLSVPSASSSTPLLVVFMLMCTFSIFTHSFLFFIVVKYEMVGFTFYLFSVCILKLISGL